MRRITMVVGSLLLYQLAFSIDSVARDLDEPEKEIIANVIKDRLRDPESARFKWQELVDGDTSVYCGLVNSKNAFGGYAGFAPFEVFILLNGGKVVFAHPVIIGTSDPGSSETYAAIKVCREHGYILY